MPAQYTASILVPATLDNGLARGVRDVNIAGTGWTGTTNHAIYWFNGAPTDLNPTGFSFSAANGVSDAFQVGGGHGSVTGNNDHALLWSGSAASVIDLNPTGFTTSWAYAVDGGSQVGTGKGSPTSQKTHALLWSGSPSSAVDLNPTGYDESEALAVSGSSQVGDAHSLSFGNVHAMLWNGTSGSALDLNPSGFTESWASGVSGSSQVGYGDGSGTDQNFHALLWTGSAASAVDLNPSGFDESRAYAAADGYQVGAGLASDGNQHALLWTGSAASALDLQSALTGLTFRGNSVTITSSYATGVDSFGNVVGYGLDANLNEYALLWSAPVPEPGAFAVLGIGILALFGKARRR
ncbi:MAG TPA: PEP-CTERM sorting domain-containing protein [Fimbriimonadaceae bacterium]|nr:PEP-CTERM sorting domain-containing protein [Fimbriimonadaceae bacterium]